MTRTLIRLVSSPANVSAQESRAVGGEDVRVARGKGRVEDGGLEEGS